jgi:arginase family enzyme
MEFDFLKPVEHDLLVQIKNFSTLQLATKMFFHTSDNFPDLSTIQIAIVGVLENRGAPPANNITNLSHIRKELYSLFPGNWDVSIADLGTILVGETIEDSYYALKNIVASLIKMKIVPIIIGGSQDLTYSLYRAYDDLEQMVNLVTIDSEFDFGNDNNGPASTSFLTKIISEEPHNLYNYCNLGYQTYNTSQEEIDLIDKLYFEAYRLGDISNSIELAEPILRDADLVSVDMTSVASASSGNFTHFKPNGFNGKEICSLSRYAGISDKVSVFAIFNDNSSQQESTLIAQMVWYFIEGFHCRYIEYPFGSRENYIKYNIPLTEELIFYKSNKTDRWWIEIPFISSTNTKRSKSSLLPCSYNDYLGACNQEIPERWWKAQRKNSVQN